MSCAAEIATRQSVASTSVTALRARVVVARRDRRPGRRRRRRRSASAPPTRVVLLVAKRGSRGRSRPARRRRPGRAPAPRRRRRRRAGVGAVVVATAAASGRGEDSDARGRRSERETHGQNASVRGRNERGQRANVSQSGRCTRLAFAVGPCTVPGQAEPPEGFRGTGEPRSWGEPRRERRGAQALSAPARQLTPQADERGLCRCPRGRSPQSSLRCCASSPRPGRSLRPPPAAPPSRRSRRRPPMLEPGLWTGLEVPGTRPCCSRTAPPPLRPTRPSRSSRPSGPRTRCRSCRTATAAGTTWSSTSPRAPTAPAPSRSRCKAAGLLKTPLDSGSFMKLGREGQGRWITVFTNPGHAYAVIAGLRLDTSVGGQWPRAPRASPPRAFESGPRWRPLTRSPRGLREAPPALVLSARRSAARPLARPDTLGVKTPTRR